MYTAKECGWFNPRRDRRSSAPFVSTTETEPLELLSRGMLAIDVLEAGCFAAQRTQIVQLGAPNLG